MIIIPAVDIKGGKCVRLFKGRFDKEEIMGNDPVKIAKDFKKEGARWLHVVDLDGAEGGKLANEEIIKKIKHESGLKIEIGGGIRDIEIIQNMLDMDMNQIILGTMAIKNPYVTSYLDPAKIIICVDAKGDNVLIKGWQEQADVKINDLITTFLKLGVYQFEYTDVDKDGTLSGPNFEQINQIRKEFPRIDLGVAGGISTIDDLHKLTEMEVDHVIIGKALYTNQELQKYVSDQNYSMS